MSIEPTVTTAPKKDRKAPSKMQRILDDHDEMIRRQVAMTGRRRQAIVNDALDAGLGLVTLWSLDPEAAQAIMTELQRKLFRNFPGQS